MLKFFSLFWSFTTRWRSSHTLPVPRDPWVTTNRRVYFCWGRKIIFIKNQFRKVCRWSLWTCVNFFIVVSNIYFSMVGPSWRTWDSEVLSFFVYIYASFRRGTYMCNWWSGFHWINKTFDYHLFRARRRICETFWRSTVKSWHEV